jgi:hypothetical protein
MADAIWRMAPLIGLLLTVTVAPSAVFCPGKVGLTGTVGRVILLGLAGGCRDGSG